jgi:hypothetical protein
METKILPQITYNGHYITALLVSKSRFDHAVSKKKSLLDIILQERELILERIKSSRLINMQPKVLFKYEDFVFYYNLTNDHIEITNLGPCELKSLMKGKITKSRINTLRMLYNIGVGAKELIDRRIQKNCGK